MKSVGEVMAIGRTFQESFQKALRGLETDITGLNEQIDFSNDEVVAQLRTNIREPSSTRIWYVADAFRAGFSVEQLFESCHIDPWFLTQIHDLVMSENDLRGSSLADIDKQKMYGLKRKGFSDARLAELLDVTEEAFRTHRYSLNVRPVFKRVDSCAAEFAATTAYLYSTYEEECESEPTDREKIMVLGGGPNRIGQGIEFDYCCVHAAFAMREDGYETIMVNCNPETVSTDYDTSDRLYFESLTLEDVLEIIAVEKPKGVIVQYGGQTPLKLARDLEKAGVPIIGTSPDSIDLAEDRERFQQMMIKLDILQPPNTIASSIDDAKKAATEVGFPLVVRPSYVLGGRAMEIVYNDEELMRYMTEAVSVSNDSPVLLDKFLDEAIEVDVDAICDGKDVFIGGIMQHIEQAGVHSGDSACSLPPYDLDKEIQDELREQVKKMAIEMGVIGLMNTQFAIQGRKVYILEVNPRASRTVPFVSKAIGLPLAKIAARCMAGKSLVEQGVTAERIPGYYSVKEAVFPFVKFLGVDPILGPEMKSTGEVMGVGETFGEAYLKSLMAAGVIIPTGGTAFVSVRNADKPGALLVGKQLVELGFKILATGGTAKILQEAGVACERINKVMEGRPHIVDLIKNDQIDFIVNTTEGKKAIADSFTIRREALQHKVSYTTTVAAASATCLAIQQIDVTKINRVQDLHKEFEQ
jgi:carbamoyl-phosphate synthase large subunit